MTGLGTHVLLRHRKRRLRQRAAGGDRRMKGEAGEIMSRRKQEESAGRRRKQKYADGCRRRQKKASEDRLKEVKLRKVLGLRRI